MTTEKNNGNPYGQYGNSDAPNPAEAEQNGNTESVQGQQGQTYSAAPHAQQVGNGQPYSGNYTGYNAPQAPYGNNPAPNGQQPNYQVAPSSPYSTPGYAYGQQPNTYQPYGAPGVSKPKGLAVASLVLSIIGFLLSSIVIGGIFALVGLILGIVALRKTKTGGGGKGLAIAGIVLSVISLLISIAVALLFGWVFMQTGDCWQYSNDEVLLEQCINDTFGANESYGSSYNS